MQTFGLIGYPLSHSFSANYFSEKFKKENIQHVTYKLFPLKNLQEFKELIMKEKFLKGLNVTIPYKQTIIPFLDKIDESTSAVGAVNTIKIIHKTGKKSKITNDIELVGYNTDIYGFQQAIKPFLEIHHTRALILGTGGAAKAVAYVLSMLGIEYFFVSRNEKSGKNEQHLTYKELNLNVIKAFPFIINATPLGMFPNIESFPPIPYEYLTKKHFLFDLIYNPAETYFVKEGKSRGALTQNGLTMLYLQAEKSWEIWNDK